jgi:hypothetical protein
MQTFSHPIQMRYDGAALFYIAVIYTDFSSPDLKMHCAALLIKWGISEYCSVGRCSFVKIVSGA